MSTTAASSSALPNGAGAAAVLAAGVGSFALGLLDVIADKVPAVNKWMNFHNPTGALSGVTTCTIFVWLATWAILQMRWRGREVRLRPISLTAILLLAAGMLLTFPPLADLF